MILRSGRVIGTPTPLPTAADPGEPPIAPPPKGHLTTGVQATVIELYISKISALPAPLLFTGASAVTGLFSAKAAAHRLRIQAGPFSAKAVHSTNKRHSNSSRLSDRLSAFRTSGSAVSGPPNGLPSTHHPGCLAGRNYGRESDRLSGRISGLPLVRSTFAVLDSTGISPDPEPDPAHESSEFQKDPELDPDPVPEHEPDFSSEGGPEAGIRTTPPVP